MNVIAFVVDSDLGPTFFFFFFKIAALCAISVELCGMCGNNKSRFPPPLEAFLGARLIKRYQQNGHCESRCTN